MARDDIPDDIRRFILTSITSVPLLEAMLLLRNEPELPWDASRLAQRLYITERAAVDLLVSLHAASFLDVAEESIPSYCYRPANASLGQIIDRLADVYAKHLVEVTNLIHARSAGGTNASKVQQFADAFKWRKDS